MTDRTPTDFALEHAEYMAKDAERLLEALNEHAAAYMVLEEGSDEDADQDITAIRERCEQADEALGEHMAHMRTGIHGFRTRRDRALATPAPAQPDPLHVANERGEGWQPIETAPERGIILLGLAPNEEHEDGYVSPGYWMDSDEDGPDNMGHDAGFVDVHFDFFSCARSFGNPTYQHKGIQPTHWMPLPAAPKEKK